MQFSFPFFFFFFLKTTLEKRVFCTENIEIPPHYFHASEVHIKQEMEISRREGKESVKLKSVQKSPFLNYYYLYIFERADNI